VLNIIYKSIITNMAMVEKSEIVSDEFNAAQICTSGK
jgi:hypothetical protein